MTVISATPTTFRNELADSEKALQNQLQAVPDADTKAWLTADSGLPDWSRGHVVSHLLGNLEGLRNLVEWARTGVETPMYESKDARDTAIQERSSWPMSQLLKGLITTAADFAEKCAMLAEPVGTRVVRLGSGGAAEAWELPMLRVREIEIHRVDLADTYHPADWSKAFTLRTMGQIQPAMAERRKLPVSQLRATDTGRVWDCAEQGPLLWGAEAELLAWLIGRPASRLRLGSPIASEDRDIPTAPRWV